MRKTASKRHRRKTNGRMTKRVRKSRQSRKRNMYVGGGGAHSRALPIDISTFDNIKTPNITYWNNTTGSPFAVFEYMDGREMELGTIAGKWGRGSYMYTEGGVPQHVYKNFDMIYKDLPNGKNVRNMYTRLKREHTSPAGPYAPPPVGKVTNFTPDATEVTIGGVTYQKYNEAIHNPPERTPGNREGSSAPLLERYADA